MKAKEINANWELRVIGENPYGIQEEFIPAKVPGSMLHTLLEAELIPDPYYRDNELLITELCKCDCEYKTVFDVTAEMLTADATQLLRFDGIDTLAEVYLNGELLGETKNMHRYYEFDVTDSLKEGANELKVYIHSPIHYIRAEQEKIYTGGSQECMEGFPHLRKAHCMFGWDWGPRVPDCGIFRPVRLLTVETARFDSFLVRQKHDREAESVTLDFDVSVELFAGSASCDCDIETEVEVTVTSPDGREYTQDVDGSVFIPDAQLWWPNGYGAQPLYTVRAELVDSNGNLLDVWEKAIGLRTMTMNTEKDQWGERFAHEVNGVCVFAMGADYIPEDNLMPRITKERTEDLLLQAKKANHNCIRIWGGGYYPDDYFYDACDKFGLMVWQDFMFSCASYELDDEFDENIREEVRQNIRRIRHHASLGLWCGNNEMEAQVIDKAWRPSKKQVADYIKLYEYIIPSIVKEEDPDAFYWPSSPSSGGSFDEPWAEDRGDAHYWDVWHGGKPFTEYRKFCFRYLSEFGFQAFPEMSTIEKFTVEKDRNAFSRVMEMHQRNAAANGKIMNYLAATYQYPKNFEQFVYVSQLLQADAIRYGVEHFRRNRGRCMGAVVWQLNDIWPVVSWASIDYYGRWKALHYSEKRMFNPIMISCEEHGEIDQRPFCIAERKEPIELSIRLNVCNETMAPVKGVVRWALRDAAGKKVSNMLDQACYAGAKAYCINEAGKTECGFAEGSMKVEIPALSALWLDKVVFEGIDELSHYVDYSFTVEWQEEAVSAGTALFTAPKHFEFIDPELKLSVDCNRITVKAGAFAKSVYIASKSGKKLELSDNFFDLTTGERTVYLENGEADRNDLTVQSVYDIT